MSPVKTQISIFYLAQKSLDYCIHIVRYTAVAQGGTDQGKRLFAVNAGAGKVFARRPQGPKIYFNTYFQRIL